MNRTNLIRAYSVALLVLLGGLIACQTGPEFTGAVSLVALNTEIQEANASLRITFTLDGVNTSDVPLNIAYSLGSTATADEDYTVTNSVVQVNSGFSTADLVLSVIQDEDVEEDETIIVTSDGTQEFYDLSSDPYEANNLLNGNLTPLDEEMLEELRSAAAEIRSE
ncbi:MAG TPA: hypothetical protein DCE41_35750 [Cytophagales bacterium]|nr:hypothetical protein [Cytophagales bacterium]HAA18657.1 hypothetical protein [Cytophagales bacterium]HAP62258.1 hypothetical protein [Cytophagales bacterium]